MRLHGKPVHNEFRVEVHLPISVAADPDGGDVDANFCDPVVAGCAEPAVVGDGGHIGRKDRDLGIDDAHGIYGAGSMELTECGENLFAGRNLFRDGYEIGLHQAPECCDVPAGICLPERLLSGDDFVGGGRGLSLHRRDRVRWRGWSGLSGEGQRCEDECKNDKRTHGWSVEQSAGIQTAEERKCRRGF